MKSKVFVQLNKMIALNDELICEEKQIKQLRNKKDTYKVNSKHRIALQSIINVAEQNLREKKLKYKL